MISLQERINEAIAKTVGGSKVKGLDFEVDKISSKRWFSIKHKPSDMYVVKFDSAPIKNVSVAKKIANEILSKMDWSGDDVEDDAHYKNAELLKKYIKRENSYGGNYVASMTLDNK